MPYHWLGQEGSLKTAKEMSEIYLSNSCITSKALRDIVVNSTVTFNTQQLPVNKSAWDKNFSPFVLAIQTQFPSIYLFEKHLDFIQI